MDELTSLISTCGRFTVEVLTDEMFRAPRVQFEDEIEVVLTIIRALSVVWTREAKPPLK